MTVAARILRKLSEQVAPLACAVGLALIIGLYAHKQPLILSPFGVASLANASIALALAAMGQTAVLYTAGLDLSIGAQIGLVNCFAATVMGSSTGSIVVVVVASLLLGLLTGAINGLVVAYARIEPLIATFCTYFIYSGLALIVRPQPGGFIPGNFAQTLAGFWGLIPFSLLLLLGCVVLVWVPVFRSRLGRYIVAVGDNPDSAYASGINVNRVRLSAYVISGFFAAVAGLFLAAETTSGDPGIGDVYTLNSLAAAVLGGVALTGGRGTVIGAILGSFVLSIILNALGVWGISAFWQDFIEGWILIVVLTLAGLRLLRASDWISILRG